MRTVHTFQRRVTYIEDGWPHVRNMEFTISFMDLADSPEKVVNIQQHLARNVFAFFDQEMLIDSEAGLAQFKHISFPHHGLGIDIVSQDLSDFNVIADALSTHLSTLFSCNVQAYSCQVDDNKTILRSLQIGVSKMQCCQMFDIVDGTLVGYEVLTDKTDVPKNVVLDKRIEIADHAPCIDVDPGTKSRGFSPYLIKGIVSQAGAINGQALINQIS